MIMLKFNGIIYLFISWVRIFIMNSKYTINIFPSYNMMFFSPSEGIKIG